MKRDQRVRLQDQDDGDPDDTVYVAHYDADGASAHQYHEAGCRYLTRARNGGREDPDQMTREGAQLRWLAPCRACVLGDAGFPLSDTERDSAQSDAGES